MSHITTKNIHMIAVERRIEEPRVNIVIRGEAMIGSNRLDKGKETYSKNTFQDCASLCLLKFSNIISSLILTK